MAAHEAHVRLPRRPHGPRRHPPHARGPHGLHAALAAGRVRVGVDGAVGDHAAVREHGREREERAEGAAGGGVGARVPEGQAYSGLFSRGDGGC